MRSCPRCHPRSRERPPVAAPKEIKTDSTGRFSLALPAGVYEVHVASPGFDGLDRTVTLTASAVRLDAQLSISTESVQVDVPSENSSTASDENKNAMVFGGKQMDALSADDSTFQQEVLAMAGGTGEGGAELYVDGFSGGRFPPKDTIREIRINQNPFSAQYNGFRRRPGGDLDQAREREGARVVLRLG